MRPSTDWVIEALTLYEGRLLRYAKWLLGDLEAARDIVQETFLRLCREDHRRLDGRVAPWLFTVCRNLAIDARKQAGRLSTLDAADIAVAADLDARHDARQALAQVLSAIEMLPPNQREVVYLKFQGGLSYKEISAVTGLSVSNVGFLLHTAGRAIRTHVGAPAAGAGHEYSSHQPERSAVDSLRTWRARK
jgi:RNA polymerase sigma factor (sigma-70 family)